ncbi:MAG: transcriptional regulator NrdR [Elusimicrobiota bacterium]
MKCPFCGWHNCGVSDTRQIENSSIIKRRRECARCKKRFTTFERVEIPPLTVIKSDGKRAPFDLEKLRKGVRMACLKRPVPEETIERIISEIEMELHDYIMEVPSKTIGEMVLKRLRKIDEVAYVRFASIYRKFDSIDTFLKELRKLKRRK